jgi:hypothetical protein
MREIAFYSLTRKIKESKLKIGIAENAITNGEVRYMREKKEKLFKRFRAAVVENDYTLKIIALELGLTQQALNEKLHGRSEFTLAEMITSCNLLSAPIDIFFDPKLHNLQFIEKVKLKNCS